MLSVVVALLAKLWLAPFIGKETPFLLFFGSVMVSAWYGGVGPGLLASVLAALAVDYFFLPPYYSLGITGSHTVVQITAFLMEGLLISWIVEARAQANEASLERARQQAVVADLGQRALADIDLSALMDETVALVARTLDVEYSKILELLPGGDALLLRAGVGWNEGLVGRATVGAGADSQAGYTLASRAPVIVPDLRRETRFSGPPLLHDHGVVSGMSVIIHSRDGADSQVQPFGVLGVHTIRRRTFTQDDIHFLQAVAHVLATTIQRRQAEEERARLLAELRARADREALVNRIGRAQRASDDPESVQRVAVEELGRALGADRCYFATYDIPRDRRTVGQDWHRDNLPSLAGEYVISDYGIDLEAMFSPETSLVIEDVRSDPRLAALPPSFAALRLRSGIAVPQFENGQLVAVLTVAMADEPRAWTTEEVLLVEAVAAQTRSTLRVATLLQREKTIAEHLQRALTPQIPGQVPGLDVASYYQPALAEASVGGDFFDVFSVEKGCIGLVVGDLSGKGLHAASQVATVRNMLRYALYRGQHVAEAVTELNDTLIEHNLLVGFVTLFIGLYDVGAGALTYVCCGHEPGLLRRSGTGQVEELTPTGPVVGVFAHAEYESRDLALRPGDALALYTDGLSEAGRDRYEFLGVGGLANLLQNSRDQETAAQVAERIVSGAEAHARANLHDDVCLLVAVVQGKS